MAEEHFECAVVGSGPNGLAAAITLATAGRSVLVLEAASTIGGGARTAELTLPGFRHDICSAIHPMAVQSPFFSTLPLARHGLQWIQPPLPLAHPLDEGPTPVLAQDFETTAASLGTDGPRWTRWLQPFAKRWTELSNDAMAPLGIPSSPLLMARFGLTAMRSAEAAAATHLKTTAGRALFAGLAGHSVLPLSQTPSAAIGLMLGVAGHAVGWPMPEGGAGALSDALAAHLRSLGGVIRSDSPVLQLDDVPTTGPVLFDTSPHRLADIAGDALPLGFRRALQRYTYGPGIFKIDYALDAPIPWRDPVCAKAGTVHLGGSFEEIAASEAAPWRGEHAQRPYVLLAQQSMFDPTRAPEGKHTGWAYCHVPNGSTQDMTEAIEAQIERFAPGFKDTVLARHRWTTMTMEAHNPNLVGGDVVGGAATIDQLFTRPVLRTVPYSTPNPRIWLGSASTPPGGGVHGMCGHHAAKALLKRWPV